VHLELRVPADESAGRAGVVEVDVRQDEVAEVLDRESLPGEAFLERAQARRGAAIDQRRLVTGEEVGRDHPRAPEVLEVDQNGSQVTPVTC
jgi:hypothetical protein